MKRASSVEMRKALQLVDEFKKAGILFVPVPVMSDDDHAVLISILSTRINAIEQG